MRIRALQKDVLQLRVAVVLLGLALLGFSCCTRGATVTAYCNDGSHGCRICCGPNPTGLTAAGTRPSSVTVAGPRSVPLGTWVEITLPGRAPVRKRVEDRTAKRFDGRWDLFFPDHASAKRFGIVTNASVRILR